MVELKRVQWLLSELIRAPEGVAPAVAGLSPDARALWEGLVRPYGQLDAVARLDIYANMYFFRIRDAVADDFPTLRATIGAERFHNLMTDYLLEHPSRSFTLRDVGRALPAFLRQHSLLHEWPWLADLAELEWAVVEAFDAADRPPAGEAELARVPAEVWGQCTLLWHPSLRVLACGYPVHLPWQRWQNDEEPGEVSAAQTWLRIWRRDERVFVTAVSQEEAHILKEQESLGALAERLAAQWGEEAVAQRLATWLAEWVQAGIVCGLEPLKCRAQT
ncbi:MAG: DNA-binding domain-containing protein [Candidatus Binatia bacterium]|nr:DNA-binding domain-containing protein [Candidatus Binatia bacterium]